MIRRATPADVQPITDMIYELADYQKALDECTVKAEQISEALFGPAATAFAHVAVNSADDVVGMALWFRNFSTWDGAHGIYLEDLYVKPSQRGSGHGKALLAALAKECTDNDYTRLSWSVLNWNTPSIKFYESLGADAKTEWTTYRLTGTHLGAFAAEAGVGLKQGRRSVLLVPRLFGLVRVSLFRRHLVCVRSVLRCHPSRRRSREQAAQSAENDDTQNDAERHLMRIGQERPGDRQEQQLRDDGDCPAPPAARQQSDTGCQHRAAEDRDPGSKSVSVGDALIVAGRAANHCDDREPGGNQPLQRHEGTCPCDCLGQGVRTGGIRHEASLEHDTG